METLEKHYRKLFTKEEESVGDTNDFIKFEYFKHRFGYSNIIYENW